MRSRDTSLPPERQSLSGPESTEGPCRAASVSAGGKGCASGSTPFHSALLWILRSHQSRPIPRYWIDHPYGEEEIALLEEELLPALEAFLARTGEIDAVIEAAKEAEVERVQAAMAAEAWVPA